MPRFARFVMHRFLTPLLAASALTLAAAQDQPAPSLKLEVKADYLALRVTGMTNITSDTWQWRVQPHSAEDQVAWSNFDAPETGGTFKLATPMPAGGWYRVEVRAVDGEKLLKSARVTRPEPEPMTMVTPERVAMLPETSRQAWLDYLAKSKEHAQDERAILAAECREARMPVSIPAPASREEFEFPSKVDSVFFASADAAKLADSVLSYQTPTGAWSKAVDYTKGPRPRGTHWTNNPSDAWHYCGTLDNRSTTEQIEFLAQVYLATKRDDCRKSVERGLEWLLAAQFPNGGFPQVYPLEPGYHEAITLNDNAMVHALEVLRSVSLGEAPFTFLDDTMKERAAQACERGLACVLAFQVRMEGRRSVWCAQHDPLTLAPVAARLKEPPSLSGAESAELLKFLMRKAPVTPPVCSAIEDAVAWLDAHKVTGMRKTKAPSGMTDYVQDTTSTEVYWARFYDLEKGKPIFAGAEDGKIYATYHEMAQHNKVGYDYYTTKPRDIVTKEMVKWKKRVEKESADAK